MRGFFAHLLLTLRLNFRNPQAVVFGYVVPVFFLFAFVAFYGYTWPRFSKSESLHPSGPAGVTH